RATVLLRVFDLKGREIQTLVNGVLEAGSYEALWDGRNKDARPMASGIYFLRLEQGKRVASRKLLLLK
ncbi:MAG: FlgD immunoglobulin-like domain containing protein, partial [Candidatus Krumholzibacteria bacterium]|nr:FlgD immunoglobulin-like domain containing protein [Candidatus Krumholzibacteria bacterium]